MGEPDRRYGLIGLCDSAATLPAGLAPQTTGGLFSLRRFRPATCVAARHDKIPKVVIGATVTFQGSEAYVQSRGVELAILQDVEYIQPMHRYTGARPELRNEDTGD